MKDKNWINQIGADGQTFGERLKGLLTARNVTAQQVSVETGITESAISNYQRDPTLYEGRCPRSDVILELAKYFGVSTDYLYGLCVDSHINPDVRSIAEFVGLSGGTIEKLHSYPAGSIQQNFIKRYMEDLLYEKFVESTLSDLQDYIEARKIADEHGQLPSDDSVVTLTQDGKYVVRAREAQATFLTNAVASAEGVIFGIVNELFDQAFIEVRCGKKKLEDYRWEIYSEYDQRQDVDHEKDIDWSEWE